MDGAAGTGDITEVAELSGQPEYAPVDSASRGKVHVQVPEGYECSEHTEVFKPQNGEEVEIEGTLVILGESRWLLILVDDAGFFDWWYSGSEYGATTTAGFVDAAAKEPFNSSWRVTIGGHDATVLIQGSADGGGEISGGAYVFLDGATIGFSAVLPPQTQPDADAYSAFFNSEEIEQLLAEITISSK